jgi:hypothetical protein
MFTFPVTLFAGAAEFPVVVSTNTSATNASQANHTVNLPGSIVAGNLLIVVASIGTGTAQTVAISGFAQLHNNVSGGDRLIIFTKTADGSEGATINMTTSGNVPTAENSYQISGWGGIEAASTTGTGANPDPPNLSPSWAITKTLWLAAVSARTTAGNVLTVSTFPSTFTDGIQASWALAVAPGGVAGSARLASAVASMDPGTFALNTGSSVTWTAGTIGINPA